MWKISLSRYLFNENKSQTKIGIPTRVLLKKRKNECKYCVHCVCVCLLVASKLAAEIRGRWFLHCALQFANTHMILHGNPHVLWVAYFQKIDVVQKLQMQNASWAFRWGCQILARNRTALARLKPGTSKKANGSKKETRCARFATGKSPSLLSQQTLFFTAGDNRYVHGDLPAPRWLFGKNW